jgi:hypothetical protein
MSINFVNWGLMHKCGVGLGARGSAFIDTVPHQNTQKCATPKPRHETIDTTIVASAHVPSEPYRIIYRSEN